MIFAKSLFFKYYLKIQNVNKNILEDIAKILRLRRSKLYAIITVTLGKQILYI